MSKKNKITIRELPNIERPREKLIKYGPDKLSDQELLAILLRSGTKDENVLDLAGNILKKFSKYKLPYLNYNDLRVYPGLGPAKACEIIACFELGKRFLKDKQTRLYMKPSQVWEVLKDIRESKKEHFVIFYLDTKNQEITQEIISIGTLNASLVHPREVFEPAVRNLASQIIVAHNHPSGDNTPSQEDLNITQKLVESGKILGIEVIDHVIVSKNNFFSFRDNKLL
ncbi:MAG TPA: DNA repair protein RadC [Bacteroidales bacterium]|jgi:DNA repair protein RadC|nr:DNA repair protein RadC [Bacteroidales bacterium]HPU46798.1 DNA repair protein RadC [Bacteroidales bacterium]HPZ36611.1 DNA repair protein RadC [Bacteroidales bacterium]